MATLKEFTEALMTKKFWGLDKAASDLRSAPAQPSAPKGYEAAAKSKVPNKPHYKPAGPANAAKPAAAHFNRGAAQAPAQAYVDAAEKARAGHINTASKITGTPTLRAGGSKLLNVGKSIVSAPAYMAGAGIAGAAAGLNTPTEQYEKRFAMDPSNIENPALRGLRDVGVRILGVGSDVANAATFGQAGKLYRDLQEQENPLGEQAPARAAPVAPPAATTAVQLPDGRPPMGEPVIPGKTSLGELVDRPGVGAVTGPDGKTVQLRTAPVAGPTGPNPAAYAPHQGGTGPAARGSTGIDMPGGIFGLMGAAGLARAAVADQVRGENMALRTRAQDIALDRSVRESNDRAMDRGVKREQMALDKAKYGFEQGVKRGERNEKLMTDWADSISEKGKDGKPLPQEAARFRSTIALTLSNRGMELKDLNQEQIQNLQQGLTVKKLIESNPNFFGPNFQSDDLADFAPIGKKGSKYVFRNGAEIEAEQLIGGERRFFKANDPIRKDVQRWLDQSIKDAEASRKPK